MDKQKLKTNTSDIQNLKKRITQLEITEEKFRNMIQTIPDIIYELDEEGKFIFISDIIRLLGYIPEELIGKHFMEIIHPSDIDLVSRQRILPKLKGKITGDFDSPKLFDERRSGDRTTKSLVVRIASKNHGKNNDYRFTEIFSSGVWSTYLNHDDYQNKYFYTEIYSTGKWKEDKNKGNNKFIGTIGVIRDITARKKIESELINAKKFESISILGSRIAHDFNNLLIGILGNISLIKDELKDNNEIFDIFKNIENAALRAKDLIQQLSTFSKERKLNKQTIDIRNLVKEVTNFTLTNSNIKYKFFFDEKVSPVSIDVTQITQVINNILMNAIQSISQNGVIEIEISDVNINELNGLPIANGRYVRLAFKDNGKGIPEENLQKIFDPYFTTRENGQGLGLSTCFSILRQHNGYIDVVSNINQGSTFYIYLKPNGTEENNINNINNGLKHKKILIMDNDELILKSTKKILIHLGYEVEAVKDNINFIDIYINAKNNNTPFDIVILNLNLKKGMNEIQIIDRLKKIDPNVKVILTGSNLNDSNINKFNNYGFSLILPKPYGIKELDKAIKDAD